MVPMESDAQRLLSVLAAATKLDPTLTCERTALLRKGSAILWWANPGQPALSIPTLNRYLSLPIEKWIAASLRQGFEGCLQVDNEPSVLCDDIALEYDPNEGLERVQQIVKDVRDRCRHRPRGDVEYRAFRLTLCEQPHIHTAQTLDFLIELGVQFKALFEDIPAHLIRGGKFYPCPCCGWPMQIHRAEVCCGAQWCEKTVGACLWTNGELFSVQTGRPISGQSAENRYRLNTALWKFTLIPGVLERRLRDRLAKLGLKPTLWPDVDRGDVKVEVADQEIWLDAKVWRSPALLGHQLASSESNGTWIVIPDYQKDYVSSLREQCESRIILTESQCISRITRLCRR
ncbi:hypothetical protein [Pseudomonas viridiflava]|uniref:restriction endonuclease-related protein n=1 Tax=Pseudomonas viridiflava TaxID=33069 RepID=UPI000F046D94|nr:hypothetical protein [Pseudomonas viridiflava]